MFIKKLVPKAHLKQCQFSRVSPCLNSMRQSGRERSHIPKTQIYTLACQGVHNMRCIAHQRQPGPHIPAHTKLVTILEKFLVGISKNDRQTFTEELLQVGLVNYASSVSPSRTSKGQRKRPLYSPINRKYCGRGCEVRSAAEWQQRIASRSGSPIQRLDVPCSHSNLR